MEKKDIKLVRIEIRAREVELEDGRTFWAYDAFKKDGKKITCKFRKEVQNAPKTAGTHYIEVEPTKMNISHAKKYDELWVSEIARVVPQEEIADKVAQKVADIFDNAE